MDDALYLQKQKSKQEAYEAMCTRCGNCCGASSGDSCVNLAKDSFNKYYCKVYENRLGKQKTLSGKEFHCIPIRLLRGTGTTFANCPYFK